MNYNTEIINARVSCKNELFLKPLQLSTGLIHDIHQAVAEITIRVRDAHGKWREGVGRGSIYLSDLWAWPDPALTHEQRAAAMRGLCTCLAQNLPSLCGLPAHPLELGLRLHNALCHDEKYFLSHFPEFAMLPLLARSVCASPFDAAIHDGVGQALNISAFDFYQESIEAPSVQKYFSHNVADAIRHLLTTPRQEMDSWLVVGAGDDLDNDVKPWISERSYRCFKLKLLGQDNAQDAARTAEVFRGVQQLGAISPRLSVDTNEANPNADAVEDYLLRLRTLDAEAFAALEYLEQPTSRDIIANSYDWRAVTKLKPVLIDEGLTNLDLLEEALRQGWSGLALKTCKGHSFTLAAAAWAKEHGLILTLQDLTNPGFSAIHAALLAAHLPTINGVELNSPQYTPGANEFWLPRLQGIFEPRQGKHRLESPHPAGLGSAL